MRKGVPLIVGNLGPATFGSDHNTLLLVDEHGEREMAHADKLSLARGLVAEIADTAGARVMTQIDLKVLDERVAEHLPAYATAGSAGLDLRACIDEPLLLEPGPGDLAAHRAGDPHRRSHAGGDAAAALGPGQQARHRAGQPGRAHRQRLPGPVDGQLLEPRRVRPTPSQPLERIAQMVIVPIVQARFRRVQEFAGSARGSGGFGSTGSA